MVRGVNDVSITLGDKPSVRYELDDIEYEVSCRLVVGADGRMSTVRRQAGIQMVQSPPSSLGGGLLVEDLHDWPVNTTSFGTEGDLLYFVYPRTGGKARLYLLHDVAQKGRFAGPNRRKDFLTAFHFQCIPGSEMFGATRPSDSCAFYPMIDSWTDQPFVPGAVLVGDAAGWSDPIIGQGLSVALRDARIVSDVLRSHSTWSPEVFESYREEREVRMRRLRVSGRIRAAMNMTFTPEGAARRKTYAKLWPTDPLLAGLRLATFKGPFGVPAESFERPAVERILRCGDHRRHTHADTRIDIVIVPSVTRPAPITRGRGEPHVRANVHQGRTNPREQL